MTDYGMPAGPSRLGVAFDVRPHAYDPAVNPELFHGVRARRAIAFVIDLVVIAVPLILAWVLILLLGVVTLGVGWLLFWLMSPASVIWPLFYYGLTLGSTGSATIGMRAMGLELRTWRGEPAYFVLGAVRAVVFWVSVSVLTPLVLLVGLLDPRKRLLHDMLVGTVVINNPARAAWLRGWRRS
jgi:uncharacterized RDD family membrane protein YckC